MGHYFFSLYIVVAHQEWMKRKCTLVHRSQRTQTLSGARVPRNLYWLTANERSIKDLCDRSCWSQSCPVLFFAFSANGQRCIRRRKENETRTGQRLRPAHSFWSHTSYQKERNKRNLVWDHEYVRGQVFVKFLHFVWPPPLAVLAAPFWWPTQNVKELNLGCWESEWTKKRMCVHSAASKTLSLILDRITRLFIYAGPNKVTVNFSFFFFYFLWIDRSIFVFLSSVRSIPRNKKEGKEKWERSDFHFLWIQDQPLAAAWAVCVHTILDPEMHRFAPISSLFFFSQILDYVPYLLLLSVDPRFGGKRNKNLREALLFPFPGPGLRVAYHVMATEGWSWTVRKKENTLRPSISLFFFIFGQLCVS